ncbi:unnamed protein product [Symbiodinium necroappetens]|uniref:Secreted protein n=1 Tax=Symbiodinium necroappetens TaxID=1628268 RepID=A0A812R9T0_9DINO|nr:unnamed protein product [Symbiodinium necroappetens]
MLLLTYMLVVVSMATGGRKKQKRIVQVADRLHQSLETASILESRTELPIATEKRCSWRCFSVAQWGAKALAHNQQGKFRWKVGTQPPRCRQTFSCQSFADHVDMLVLLRDEMWWALGIGMRLRERTSKHREGGALYDRTLAYSS